MSRQDDCGALTARDCEELSAVLAGLGEQLSLPGHTSERERPPEPAQSSGRLRRAAISLGSVAVLGAGCMAILRGLKRSKRPYLQHAHAS